MAHQLTEEDARQSLAGHVTEKGRAINEKYGPDIGWNQLQLILQDRAFVRYPCEIVFDSTPLQEGELAYPAQKGNRPEEGFVIYVHPYFAIHPARVPYLVLYQLVLVNYGEFASAEDAEHFGANALGISRHDYYQALCAMSDEITTP